MILLPVLLAGCLGQSGGEPVCASAQCSPGPVIDVAGLDEVPPGFDRSARALLERIEGTWRGRVRLPGAGRTEAELTLAWDGGSIQGHQYLPSSPDRAEACPAGFELGLVAELAIAGEGGAPFAVALRETPAGLDRCRARGSRVALGGLVPPEGIPEALPPADVDGTLCQGHPAPLVLVLTGRLDGAALEVSASWHWPGTTPDATGNACLRAIRPSELTTAD